MAKRRRKMPLVKVKQIAANRYSVFIRYWIRGEKKELRGTTSGENVKEVQERAVAWVREKQKEEARAWAALMLQRRRKTAESVMRRMGL